MPQYRCTARQEGNCLPGRWGYSSSQPFFSAHYLPVRGSSHKMPDRIAKVVVLCQREGCWQELSVALLRVTCVEALPVLPLTGQDVFLDIPLSRLRASHSLWLTHCLPHVFMPLISVAFFCIERHFKSICRLCFLLLTHSYLSWFYQVI